MLEFLRRSIKSWVAQLLLALLIVSFAVWGIGDVFTGSSARSVAGVGDTDVEAQSFANAVLRQQRLIARETGELMPLADMRAFGLDQQILNGMIRDAAFREELTRLGIAIPAAAIRDTIASNPAFDDGSGSFSQFAYQSTLNQQGYTVQEFERLTGELLGQQIMADAIGAAPSAAPGLAEALARYDGERRRVAVIRLPAADAPEPDAPGDAALQAHLEANPREFRIPERRWGVFLHADPAVIADEMAPTEAEVRATYDANPDAYSEDATRTVEQIVFADRAAAEAAADRIAAGEASFAEVAAEQNVPVGDLSLGTVIEGDLPPASSEAVFAATEPGIVGPVDGVFGALLLNVTEVTIGGQRPFDEVADDVRERLARERALRAVIDRVTGIDDRRAAGVPLAEIAEEIGLPLVRFQGLAQDGTVAEGEVPALAGDPEFLSEVRSADVGAEREIVEMTDGSYALVLIERIAESRVPELSEVRDTVARSWADEQRIEAQIARARELIAGAGAGAGTDLEAIATVTLQGIGERAAFTRAEPPADFSADLVDAVFDTEDGAMVVGRNASDSAALIVQVRGIIPLSGEAFQDRVARLDEVLTGSIGRDQLEYFARALEARHGTYVNDDGVDAVFTQIGQSGY